MIKNILITTPYEKKFINKAQKKDINLILSNASCDENFSYLDFKKKIIKLFQNNLQKKKIYNEIISYYTYFLEEIKNYLNSFHKVNYSKKYWELIVGAWLLDFLIVSYEKFLILKKITIKNLYINYFSIQRDIPKNSADASILMNSHFWNNYLFYLYAKKIRRNIKIKTYKNLSFINLQPAIKIEKLNLKDKIKKIIINLFSFFSSNFKKKNETFILNSYLGFLNEIFLQKKINRIYKFNSEKKINIKSSINYLKRVSFYKKNKLESNFVKLITPTLFYYMPKSFCEDYSKIIKFSDNLSWPSKPKKVFTSVNNFYDDIFKIWFAERNRKHNAELIYCCHGGGFQTQQYSTQNYYLLSTCKKILVWGNHKNKNDKLITYCNIKSSINPFLKEKKNKKNLNILFIQEMPERYSNIIFSSVLHFFQHNEYVKNQVNLIKKLNKNKIDKVIIRLGSSENKGSLNNLLSHEQSVWEKKINNLKFEKRNIPLQDSIKKAYIVIITQLSSTTLLECIASNIPFLIFADLKKQAVNLKFKKFLIILKKNQIFFDNHKFISNFLNEKNSKEIEKWWYSKKIQKILNVLRSNYAIYEKNPVEKLYKILK